MSAWSERRYTAKRSHKRTCFGCCGSIIVGDLVDGWTWIAYGEIPFQIRMHASCNDIALAERLWDDEQDLGFLIEAGLKQEAKSALDNARRYLPQGSDA